MISCQPCDKMVARWSFRALSCRVYTLTARALFFYFGAKNGLNLFRGFFSLTFRRFSFVGYIVIIWQNFVVAQAKV